MYKTAEQFLYDMYYRDPIIPEEFADIFRDNAADDGINGEFKSMDYEDGTYYICWRENDDVWYTHVAFKNGLTAMDYYELFLKEREDMLYEIYYEEDE